MNMAQTEGECRGWGVGRGSEVGSPRWARLALLGSYGRLALPGIGHHHVGGVSLADGPTPRAVPRLAPGCY